MQSDHSILRLTLNACVLFLLVSAQSLAQMVSVPPSHEVYPFLKRMEAKQLLGNYRDAMKPLSRLYIARMLQKLDSVTNKMTSVERSTYEFLKTDFQYELSKLHGDAEPSETRWHLFSQELTGGIFNFDLDYRYTYSKLGENPLKVRSQGITMQGYAFEDLGYYFNFIDNREVGDVLNRTKVHTPDPGIILSVDRGNEIEYDNIDAQLGFRIGKIEFSIEKTKNIWGYGDRGSVIMSNKAPSYPQIKMRVPLSNRIDFVYFHAELKSNIVDSVRSYHTYSSLIGDYYRPVERLKYMAAHQLEFSIVDGLNLSLGESVVYSDRGPVLIYLIPIMFFKAGEHYNGDLDNCQFFGSLDMSLINGLNFYLSLFIDELNTDDLLDGYKSRKQIGMTAGIHTYDKLLDNLELVAEYSRINPWAYSHKYTAANFTNNGYVLGHWVGQNGDLLYFETAYRPMRQLKLGAFSEVYRKGGLMDVINQYSGGQPDFLYGPLHEERSYGFYAKYQPLRDLFIDFRARQVKVEDEATKSKKEQFEFTLGAQLGIW